MKELVQNEENMKEVLKEFAGILAKHSEKTDRALERLVDTVDELTKSHIEAKKDREYDSVRMERIEKNQREQGKKIENISDTVLLLDERVGRHKDKWADVAKFVSAIVTAVVIAKVLPL